MALKTGMRQGELFALRWTDVDLEQAVIRVRSSYTGGALSTPKNRERRDVDLISDVVELLSRLRNGGANAGCPETDAKKLVVPDRCAPITTNAGREPFPRTLATARPSFARRL